MGLLLVMRAELRNEVVEVDEVCGAVEVHVLFLKDSMDLIDTKDSHRGAK
jgi:hypothetical protein